MDLKDGRPLGAQQTLDQLNSRDSFEHSLRSALHWLTDLTKQTLPGEAEAYVSVLVAATGPSVVYTG
jgi:hypothetical protein